MDATDIKLGRIRRRIKNNDKVIQETNLSEQILIDVSGKAGSYFKEFTGDKELNLMVVNLRSRAMNYATERTFYAVFNLYSNAFSNV